MVKSDEVANMDPNIPQENLKGAFLYYDVLNKFPRAVTSLVKSAVNARDRVKPL